jgi:hypothetical protein
VTRPPLPNGPILGGSDPRRQSDDWCAIQAAAAQLLAAVHAVEIHGRDYRTAGELGEAAQWREDAFRAVLAISQEAAEVARLWLDRMPQ